MDQNQQKEAIAKAALEFVLENSNQPAALGVGTGSTADFFIAMLADHVRRFTGAVASSEASAEGLRKIGMPLLNFSDSGLMDFYVDGADEIEPGGAMMKGGGAALTREKIVASMARRFVCIADESKCVDTLGGFPLPVEVIPMAEVPVSQAMQQLGGKPVTREGCITDNGNIILDVHGLEIGDPLLWEKTLNMIPGVVTNGIFAQQRASLLLTMKGGEIVRVDYD